MPNILKLTPTGIQAIDEQHKQLVIHLDTFLSWVDKGYSLGATFDVFQALFAYTKTHFEFEEQFLRDHGYPKLEEHIREHEAIVAQLNKLKADMESGQDVTEGLVQALRSWILQHIQVEDIEYAQFLIPEAKAIT